MFICAGHDGYGGGADTNYDVVYEDVLYTDDGGYDEICRYGYSRRYNAGADRPDFIVAESEQTSWDGSERSTDDCDWRIVKQS